MSVFDTPYIFGTTPARDGPLARFLPPLEDGVALEWLTGRVRAGSWLLDPFASSPRLVVEAARAGYRVLVTANNPVARFLLDMIANPPSESELKAALADLAVTKKGDERLEVHLQSLYQTTCANCNKEITARAFLWKKGADVPYARVYTCPECNDSGERPATSADEMRARKAAESEGLHRARLLERVAPPDDPDREYAEEALAVYAPRAIYVLATLTNRLDSSGVTPERRRILSALFLSVCDAANNLWSTGSERPRPKQLTLSNEFRENNIWLALEAAVNEWAAHGEPVALAQWPNKLPESGGVLIFEGRIAELAAVVKDAPIAAVIGALPRPNQAYWTLCALWAGWLWGRDSMEAFKIVLRRKRYDWAWHAEATGAALKHLFDVLALGTPFFGFVPEPESSFLTVALTAADASGFNLQSIAMRAQQDAAQMVWTRGERLAHKPAEIESALIRESVRDFLIARAEPAPYLYLHATALAALAESHTLTRPRETPEESYKSATTAINETLLADESLIRFRAGEGIETGLWGINTIDESLSDRVEMAAVNFLIAHPNYATLEILRDLAARFAGLLTPSLGLVGAVLNSYAEQDSGRWRLRAEDLSSARTSEIAKLADMLEAIGARMDYTTNRLDARTLVWEAGESSLYVFHLKASAVIARAVAESPYPHERTVIVLPGGRAGLLAYKQTRDPALAARLAGLRFVKFRLLRALEQNPFLARQSFETLIAGDPVEAARGQKINF